jgi:hypothetical protein
MLKDGARVQVAGQKKASAAAPGSGDTKNREPKP